MYSTACRTKYYFVLFGQTSASGVKGTGVMLGVRFRTTRLVRAPDAAFGFSIASSRFLISTNTGTIERTHSRTAAIWPQCWKCKWVCLWLACGYGSGDVSLRFGWILRMCSTMHICLQSRVAHTHFDISTCRQIIMRGLLPQISV